LLETYDAVAEIFDRLAVPLIFTPPAKDLISLLRLPTRAQVLDVGGGTGTAARLALHSLGPGSTVAVLDPSVGMLRLARRNGLALLVAGVVPGIPFPDATFDTVMANFVLSHVPSYQAALADMARVLRPGGWLGLTAWGSGQNECRKVWREAAESFVKPEELDSGLSRALPWEAWFADPGHLEDALREVGLAHIEVHHAEYNSKMPMDDFLAMREITCQARLMNKLLDEEEWNSFRLHVRNEFHRRCPGMVAETRDAYLAVGAKPNP